jgi:hypothetical protein
MEDVERDAELERLVEAAAGGEEAAWQGLWVALEPRLGGLVRKPSFLGRIADRPDLQRDIVLEVMARLRADGWRRLQVYLEARRDNPRLRFMSWLGVVAKRVGVDVIRASPDYLDRRRDAEPVSSAGKWVDPVTLPPDSQMPGARPPMTRRGTAMEILRHAGTAIPDDQRRALELWTQNQSFDEIAGELALPGGAKEAERLVRAALDRLRRHFRDEDDA